MPQSQQRSEPTAEDFAFARLLSYSAYQWPGYRDARHHRMIARKLEAVERGEIDRLMIFMPPRHGKSMLASEYFPAWYLGRNPDHYVVAATYGQELADDFGRKVKNQLSEPLYQGIFPGVTLADDSKSSKRFHVNGCEGGFEHTVTQRGAYYAVGVGGPLTGRGAHLMLIDDPIKNREDADSELVRKKLKEWYTSTAYTRLMPGGKIIVIQTRWHEDDLAGWLLKEHADEGWDVLDLPAINRASEPLWPEQYDLAALMRIKAAISSRDWSALYQQRPSPAEGTFFKRDWFRRYTADQLPSRLHKYITSDHAPGGEADDDFNVVRVWGVDPTGDLWMVDGFREQTTLDKVAERVVGVKKDKRQGLITKHRPFCWFPEGDNNWKSAAGFITKSMREQNVHCRIEPISPHGADKQSKAQAFQAMAASGRVWIPVGPEGDAVIDQYVGFPGAKNDDEVDAASVIGRALADAHPAIAEHKTEEKKRDRWDDDDGDDNSPDWRTT